MATDDFLGTICIGDNNNYYNLEFGFSNGNSNKYNSNTDRYAPPPPPQNFFDAALNYKGERYYSKIINPINETFYIMLQYGENNTINIKWDNSDWNKILDACVLQNSFTLSIFAFVNFFAFSFSLL